MSRNTSPGHRFSGAYDNFYDPDFTVQISSKMQVPDKISVIEGAANKENVFAPREYEKMQMHVPERILVAGGNEHVEAPDPLPEVRLESAILSHPVSGIALHAPPRVLTLDECSYPTVDEKSLDDDKKQHDAPLKLTKDSYEKIIIEELCYCQIRLKIIVGMFTDQDVPLVAGLRLLFLDSLPVIDQLLPDVHDRIRITYTQDNSVNNVHPAEDEVTLLRMQVKLLSRRIASVEQDNQLRQQREIILYSVGALYFLLKGMLWLHRHF